MNTQKRAFLGNSTIISDGSNMSSEYLKISQEDEAVADLLYTQGYYNQSLYFYIQSMEKYIKSYICQKIDITNSYFAEEVRSIGHSLDRAVDFLIEIMSGNSNVLKEQLNTQLKSDILQDIRFSMLYNSTRYPFYKNPNYIIIKMGKKDCDRIRDIYLLLKKYLKDLLLKL